MPAVALTIAGSDPSGGAGIQADLKTFYRFGVYGEAVITLLTVQNTHGVSRIEMLSPELVSEQIDAVVSDLTPHAAKTGALGSIEIVRAVSSLAERFTFPLVVDPVMISKHGARLITPEAEQALKTHLFPHAALVTPNIPEAESLTGITIETIEDMAEAGRRLLDSGCRAVLVKGGHRWGEPVDLLVHSEGVHHFPGKRIDTLHTHGTGCTYSAAITAGVALGYPLHTAVSCAKAFIQSAIESAPKLGTGYGPVDHFAPLHS
jgi:hydroxymethylpyrimidine/phosphomethylpyrimidine kinase